MALRALAEAGACELAGCERYLGLVLLPVDARVVRVYAGVIGREDAVALIVLEEVGPEDGHHAGDGRRAHDEPVDLDARDEEHDGEDEEVHQRAAEVLRRDQNEANILLGVQPLQQSRCFGLFLQRLTTCSYKLVKGRQSFISFQIILYAFAHKTQIWQSKFAFSAQKRTYWGRTLRFCPGKWSIFG